MKHSSKGKGKRLPSPAQSSDNDENIHDQHWIPSKRPRRALTECIQASMIAKMAPNAASSSNKGLAGFSALISNCANLSVATSETNHGLKGGRSGRLTGRASSQSKAVAKTDVEGITVGTIVFFVVGVEENQIENPTDTSLFHPVYRLWSDVEISPMVVTGMKQAGLCVMRDTGFEFLSTDMYGMIDNKLQNLFPRLYEWLSEDAPLGQNTSWLICMKPPHKKSLIVYSDNSNLPNGYNIMKACTMARSKAGVQDRILYLVTRNPVPSEIVQGWCPRALSTRTEEIGLYTSDDNNEVDTSSDPPLPSLAFSNQLRQSTRLQVKNRNKESEVETEIISLSDDDSAQENAVKGDPLTDLVTPPYIADFNNTFASINFTGEDNPWN